MVDDLGGDVGQLLARLDGFDRHGGSLLSGADERRFAGGGVGGVGGVVLGEQRVDVVALDLELVQDEVAHEVAGRMLDDVLRGVVP